MNLKEIIQHCILNAEKEINYNTVTNFKIDSNYFHALTNEEIINNKTIKLNLLTTHLLQSAKFLDFLDNEFNSTDIDIFNINLKQLAYFYEDKDNFNYYIFELTFKLI